MPICFRAKDTVEDPKEKDEACFSSLGTTLGGVEIVQEFLGEVELDLSQEFDPESIEKLRRLKSWSEDPEHIVKVVTPCPLPGKPPGALAHTLMLGQIAVYYAIEAHEHGTISKTYYHLCISDVGKPLKLEDRRVALLVLFFFPSEPPNQVHPCCPYGIHFFKTFEWIH
jgi:hypothetical protein